MSRLLTTVGHWIWIAALGLSLLAVPDFATATGARTGAQIEVEVAAGGMQSTELELRNGCETARKFRLEKKKPRWLSYSEEGSTIRIGPGQTHVVELTFDASGRKPGTYDGALRLHCTDCNKDRRCHVQQQEIDVRVRVTAAPDLELLARRLERVEERFKAGRRAVESRTRSAVRVKKANELVARTDRELQQAFEAADRDGQLAPLADWGQQRLEQLGRKLSAGTDPPARTAGRFPSEQTGPPLRAMGPAATSPPQKVTVGWLTILLRDVGDILNRLIDLVERNDLFVDVTVASTPEIGARFELLDYNDLKLVDDCWTDGTLKDVTRGSYRYRVHSSGHSVIEAVLDLMNCGSRLLCKLDEAACYDPKTSKPCDGSQ